MCPKLRGIQITVSVVACANTARCTDLGLIKMCIKYYYALICIHAKHK